MLLKPLDRLVNPLSHDIHPEYNSADYNQHDEDGISDPKDFLLPDQLLPEVAANESRFRLPIPHSGLK